MKNTCIFLGHHPLILLSILILLTHCSIVESDANLIVQTCKQTPNFNLCINSLKSDPKSSKADVEGLALMMVNILKAKATTTLKLIKQQLGRNPELKKALSSCADNYDAILSADIPVSLEAIQKGDPKFAQTSANDAANEASFCETQFNGKSPLTKFNRLVHDTSAVAAAIIRLLL